MRRKLVGIHYKVSWEHRKSGEKASAMLNVYDEFSGSGEDLLAKAYSNLLKEAEKMYPQKDYRYTIEVRLVNVDHHEQDIDLPVFEID